MRPHTTKIPSAAPEQRRPRPGGRLLALAAIVVATGVSVAATPAPGGRLLDDGHRLGRRERGAVERSRGDAERRIGRPLTVKLVPRLDRQRDIDALARATFDALSGDAANPSAGPAPVVLVVALHERASSIETGDRIAGIVPEVDARAISAALAARIARREAASGLAAALASIAQSAEETAARRRPLPRQPEPPTPESDAAPTAGDAESAAAAVAAASTATDPPPEPARRRRSLFPIAAGLAGLVVLGLALRRRRRLTASTPATAPSPQPAAEKKPAPSRRPGQ